MKRGFIVAVIVFALGAATISLLGYVRRPRLTPALRGAELALELGCFGCHGPGGTGGVPNPGSEEREVPAWDGGTSMMYVENEEEIREWILYGHPKRIERRRPRGGQGGDHTHDRPGVTDSGPTPLPLRMPAFEHIVSDSQLEDLVAYYKAVAVFDPIPDDAKAGYRIASRLGCFGCHGPGGRVGSKNPRSFKGYIPPWQGKDFAEVVKSDQELRQWILDGTIERFDRNRLASFFTRRQVIQMPAYRGLLSDEELEAITTYVRWLNQERRM